VCAAARRHGMPRCRNHDRCPGVGRVTAAIVHRSRRGNHRLVSSSRRTVLTLTAAMAVTACAVGLVWLVRSSRKPVDAAGLYGFYLAVVAFAQTLLVPLGNWWEKGRTAAGGSVQAEVSGARDSGGLQAQVSGGPDGLAGAACWLAEATERTWRRAADERLIGAPASVRITWKWATGFTPRVER
jgi:hypothetical protein